MKKIFNVLDNERFGKWFTTKHPTVLLEYPMGSGKIQVFNGDSFDFSDDGQDAVIMPVFDDEYQMVNMIAWLPGAPAKWFFYGRLVDLSIGVRALNTAIAFRKPIKVHETPLDWLISGEIGAVPLTFEAMKEYRELPEIQCTPAMRKKMESYFKQMPKFKEV